MTPLYEFMTLLLTLAGGVVDRAAAATCTSGRPVWVAASSTGLTLAGEKMPGSVACTSPCPWRFAVASCWRGRSKRWGMLQAPRWQTAAAVAGWAGVGTLLLVEGGGAVALRRLALVPPGSSPGPGTAVEGRHGGTGPCRAHGRCGRAVCPYAAHEPDAAVQEPGDVPVEMAVYTQTAPDIVNIRNRIDALAESSGLWQELCPSLSTARTRSPGLWAWYLRDYHDVQYAEPRAQAFFQAKPGAVFLVNRSNLSALDASSYSQGPVQAPLVVRERSTWTSANSARCSISPPGPSRLKDLGDFFLHRRPEAGNTGQRRRRRAVRVTLVPDSNVKAVEPERLTDGRIVTGRTGAGPGDLSQPGDVFVDRQTAPSGLPTVAITASRDTTRRASTSAT